MASSKPPKDANLLLANLQDMFLSQIEPDVVEMIFATCDYNVDTAIETLLSFSGKQDDNIERKTTTAKKRQKVQRADTNKFHYDRGTTNGVKYDQLQTLNTVSDTARDSIYKSNEDLYFEGGEEIAESGAAETTTTSTTIFGCNTKAQLCNVLSPDSDKSIEGDASESMTTMATSNTNGKYKKVGSGFNAQQNAHNPGGASSKPVHKFRRPYVRRSSASASENPALADLTAQQTKLVESLIQSLKQEKQKDSKPIPLMGHPVQKWRPHQQQPHQSSAAATNAKHSHFTKKTAGVKSELANVMAARVESTNVPNNATASQKLTAEEKENDVVRRIKAGQRVLILLRGCPGSGKTTLAHKLKHNGIILSADSYFEQNGTYEFDSSQIGEAHTRTRDRALQCMQKNVTPIIIDNTNLESWEMEPYVLLAIKLRYFVVLLEPQTQWRYNPYHLVSRNTHGVSFARLRLMLHKFDHEVTVHTMLRKIGPKIDIHKQKMVMKEQKELQEKLGGILTDASRRISLTNEADTTMTVNGKQHNQQQAPVQQQQKKNKIKILQQENAVQSSSSSSVAYDELKKIVEKSQTTEAYSATGQSGVKKQKKKMKNKTLSKSSSVPNIAAMANDQNASIKHYDLVSVGGEDQSRLDSDEENFSNDIETEPLSQNMKDLMLIDFGMERDPFGDDIGSMDSSLADTLLPPMKSHRLAAAFGHNWDLPPYPIGENNEAKERRGSDMALAVTIKGAVEEDFVRFDDVRSPSTSVTSSNENDDAKIGNLKTYFPAVPIEDLRDLMEKCEGNVEWVANLLLDSGYECSMDAHNDKDGDLEQSIEEMADLGSDDDDEDNETTLKSSNVDIVGTFSYSDTTQQSKSGLPQELVLRIDPIFAMQLEQIFGPVTFHVAPESYYGNDLNVVVDLETAREIHSLWSQSLMKKFEREESTLNEIIKDEGYAKQIQEMEDARIAANLEASDRHDPEFPPLTIEAPVFDSFQKIPSNTEGLASKIKRQQLYEMFPKIDRKAVDEVFNANDGSFLETVNLIEATFCPNEQPRLVIAPELISEYENAWLKIAQQESQLMYEEDKEKEDLLAQQAVVDPSYEDLRAEATVHYHRRQDCFTRAQDAYGKNMKAVASFYSQQGHLHSQKLREANKRAMEMILTKQNSGMKSNTLDLHMLFVQEAMEALTQFINKKKIELKNSRESSLTFYVVTGKGTHSNQGQPRIKPAVVDFLNRQNYSAYEINGGTIEVKLTRDNLF